MIVSVCLNPAIDTFLYLDGFHFGKANRAIKEEKYPGGKTVHVALATKELEIPSVLFGLWAGPSGQWIYQQCENKGLRCEGVLLAEPQWNRTCLTLVGSDCGSTPPSQDQLFNDTEILGQGPQVDELIVKKIINSFSCFLEDENQEISTVVMSGSLPPGSPSNLYSTLIKECRKYPGIKIILDTTGEALIAGLSETPDIIHLNQNEFSDLQTKYAPKNSSVDYSFLHKKCKIMALTKGKEGLDLIFPDLESKRLRANVKIEKVISTIGSGDCLVAGLAYAIEKNMTILEAARMAVACGAANCIFPELGQLKRNDVFELFEKVQFDSGSDQSAKCLDLFSKERFL